MNKTFLIVGIVALFMLAFSLSLVAAESSLNYEHFRSDLMGRNIQLSNYDTAQEFYFLQQLSHTYPTLSYEQLFGKYLSLRSSYLQHYSFDKAFRANYLKKFLH